jgi:hypothetical protein
MISMNWKNHVYRFISDAGHGWLEVPLLHAKALGITGSRYSYIKPASKEQDAMLYLEEDCDAPQFDQAYTKVFKIAPVQTWNYVQGDSFVRSLPRCGGV